jgi:hypothetical protein
MNRTDIARHRLHRQHLLHPIAATPQEIVSWFGAVQSQEYPGGKWALAQRIRGVTDATIEQAFTNGEILRTHVLRPTWHFVAPADIRWMLKLTAPRVNSAVISYYRANELDDALFARCNTLMGEALAGGKHLTKVALRQVLGNAGIVADMTRLAFILLRAELDGVVVSGARQGNQQTYALLEERVPPAPELSREEALAALTLRYFTSHGPATLKDYRWWSGLTMGEVREGMELVKSELSEAIVEGQSYWFREAVIPARNDSPTVYLLPCYDEYLVGYASADRHIVREAGYTEPLAGWGDWGNIINFHTIALNEKVIGSWKPTTKKQTLTITPTFFREILEREMTVYHAAVRRYGEYLGVEVQGIEN